MTEHDLIQGFCKNQTIHHKLVRRQRAESANIINTIAHRTCFRRSPPVRGLNNTSPSQSQSSSRISIMGFVNEVVSDEDIDRYGLPFKKGSGRYWTRDAERNYYLWGGKKGNEAMGEDIEGRFNLFLDGKIFKISLLPGRGSMKYSEVPYIIAWDSIRYIDPPCSAEDLAHVIGILKEGLTAYGDDGRANKFASRYVVQFYF